MKPWKGNFINYVKYYELWAMKCLSNEESLFLWNHEMSDFMNYVSFNETMKCQVYGFCLF